MSDGEANGNGEVNENGEAPGKVGATGNNSEDATYEEKKKTKGNSSKRKRNCIHVLRKQSKIWPLFVTVSLIFSFYFRLERSVCNIEETKGKRTF